MSLFTAKQSKDFINSLRHKKHMATAIVAMINEMSNHLKVPVNIVNSGDKYLYEQLINQIDKKPNITNTTSSIQISIGALNVNNNANTSKTTQKIVLKSGGIPHLFYVPTSNVTINLDVNCAWFSSDGLEALTDTEYILDNLFEPYIVNYTVLGIQYSLKYAINTSTLEADVNKTFSYDDTPNGVNVNFPITAEIIYPAINSAKLITFINTNTDGKYDKVDIDGKPIEPPIDPNGPFGPIGPTLETEYEIVKYAGIVRALNQNNDLIDSAKYYSDNVTDEDKQMLEDNDILINKNSSY